MEKNQNKEDHQPKIKKIKQRKPCSMINQESSNKNPQQIQFFRLKRQFEQASIDYLIISEKEKEKAPEKKIKKNQVEELMSQMKTLAIETKLEEKQQQQFVLKRVPISIVINKSRQFGEEVRKQERQKLLNKKRKIEIEKEEDKNLEPEIEQKIKNFQNFIKNFEANGNFEKKVKENSRKQNNLIIYDLQEISDQNFVQSNIHKIEAGELKSENEFDYYMIKKKIIDNDQIKENKYKKVQLNEEFLKHYKNEGESSENEQFSVESGKECNIQSSIDSNSERNSRNEYPDEEESDKSESKDNESSGSQDYKKEFCAKMKRKIYGNEKKQKIEDYEYEF